MKLGLIGLGKMGYNLALNMKDKGHEVVANDVSKEALERIAKEGIEVAETYEDLVAKLPSPKVIWLMVPAGDITEKVLNSISGYLSEKDIIIDGGNSNYKESIRRGKELKEKGIYFLDCGTSGGMEGARNGVCTMIGGEQEAFAHVEQLFKDIAVENGYLYTGKLGSGHFLKMVHNGIEYGMMQAIAEGFEILEKSDFDFDYKNVSRLWNNGSVIRSWLMELMEDAFSKDEKLDNILGVMHSSGEGKWTVETALDLQAVAPVITLSQIMRYRSLENDTFSGKVVAALRNEFGGHSVVEK
ncbi:phosphogluconate dehydrogenase (NAD(+)-dependent, decarboxylating) [Heyndrickxia ginsengihumi]|uniref:6-phosphogluconate dehydrogenase n=1 Tax=Heyndrickxia ginsengihumi TaxID=363870 RepID=A0A0A6VFD4_9BACI|nr:decarboxylating 6-phosphogluconate dehydrogenase [Heyndrickxia ginsengihumi]KHD85279.1 6-phosphogluconate dehydrogenase [Heyndrickxia ginsengihumi]MBE6183530.1 decarboxylating 6-phosphogluconate dehydrogenase [Bacillus sp. (in: firmicutes)]MCM3023234.1 decarboxylating 6-phosphogluconate dehydrogenase [Heyndrickxia ginsengihumi]